MSIEVTFEDSATEFILSRFEKAVDDEGYIVEAKTGERVVTPKGEEITPDELGAIAEGSELFIRDNFVSLVDYVESKRDS